MKVGVIGQRDFRGKLYDNYLYVEEILDSYLPNLTAVVSGGGKGIESLAQKWAEKNGKAVEVVRPNFSLYSMQEAFHYRNSEIVQQADCLLIFWDGNDANPMGPASQAIKSGKQVEFVPMV